MAATVLSRRTSLPNSARSGFQMATSRPPSKAAFDGTFVVGAASLMIDSSSMPLTIVAPPSVTRCSSARTTTSRRSSTAGSAKPAFQHQPKPSEHHESTQDIGSNHAGDHQPDIENNSVRFPRLAKIESSAKPSSSDSILARTSNKIDSEVSAKDRESIKNTSPRHVRSVFQNFRVLERLAASARLRSARQSALDHLKGRKSAERKLTMLNQDNSNSTEKLLPHPPTLQKAFDNEDQDSDSPSADTLSYNNGAFIVGSGAVNVSNSTKQNEKRAKKKRPMSVKIKIKRRSRSRKTKSNTPISSALNTIGTIAGSMSPIMVVEPAKVEIYSSRYNKNKKRTERKEPLDGVPQGSRGWSNNNDDGAITLRKSLETYGPVTLRTFEHANSVYSSTPSTIKDSPTWTGKKKIPENKVTKVFLSEKQSSSIRDCGKMIPCAPPVTPMPEMLTNVEYIPSLSDLRSQRAIKNRLSNMEKEAKEKRRKQMEEAKKLEKQMQRDHVVMKKYRQRQEIYALNKAMTELEHKNFEEFCKKMNNVKVSEKPR